MGEKMAIFKELIENGLDPLDLFILKKLNEGGSVTTLHEQISEEFNIKISRNKVEDRINKLKEKGVIKPDEKTKEIKNIRIDPSKLYNHIFLVFIKVHLPSMLGPRAALTWREVFDKIKKINDDSREKPFKILFNVGGLGEYDFVGLAFVNDFKEWHKFKEKLVKEGFIEKFDTKYVEPPGGWFFEPISIPDYTEYQKSLTAYQEVFKYGKDIRQNK